MKTHKPEYVKTYQNMSNMTIKADTLVKVQVPILQCQIHILRTRQWADMLPCTLLARTNPALLTQWRHRLVYPLTMILAGIRRNTKDIPQAMVEKCHQVATVLIPIPIILRMQAEGLICQRVVIMQVDQVFPVWNQIPETPGTVAMRCLVSKQPEAPILRCEGQTPLSMMQFPGMIIGHLPLSHMFLPGAARKESYGYLVSLLDTVVQGAIFRQASRLERMFGCMQLSMAPWMRVTMRTSNH